MIMSAQFGFGGFSNAFLLGPVTAFLGGDAKYVVKNCFTLMGIGYLIQFILYSPFFGSIMIGKIIPFILIALILSLFQYSLATSITSKTSTIVPKKLQGTLMGI